MGLANFNVFIVCIMTAEIVHEQMFRAYVFSLLAKPP